MGKALRPEHLSYFTDRMDQHNLVTNCVLIANQDEYLFKIRRTLNQVESELIVHLTDAYRYGLAEYYARPGELGAGSYVVIGMPHADPTPEAITIAREDRIGVGHIGKFMGALNHTNIWEYMTPDERQRE